MVCCSSTTRPRSELLLPVRSLGSVVLTTITLLVISAAIVLHSVDAAAVGGSSDINIPLHPRITTAALNSTNATSTSPDENYWTRFGRAKRDDSHKTTTEPIMSKLKSGKDVPEPTVKPFSDCQTTKWMNKDDFNPEVDDLMLETVVEKIIVHLALNTSIVTDPANLRPRIYQRKAAASLLKELRAEDGFLPEDDNEMWVVKTPNVSSPQILNVTVEEGSRVRLVCNVTGVPDYWVEWRRWSNLTFPGGEEVVGGRSVLFDQVGREDAGNYHCTARTSEGHKHSAYLRLYVNFMPEVFVWARGGGEDGEVELGCLAEGYPQPQLAWYINNTRITNTICPSGLRVSVGRRFLAPEWSLLLLRLQGLSANAHGFYHCSATNSIARAKAIIMLHQGDMSLQPVHDLSIQRDLVLLQEEMKRTAKSQVSVFVMGMVPPIYIAFYIIVYLSCYKSQSIVGAATGRYGGEAPDAGYPDGN